MGVLKLSVIEEQQSMLKLQDGTKLGKTIRISNCSCPCECFIKEGEIVMENVSAGASWNID